MSDRTDEPLPNEIAAVDRVRFLDDHVAYEARMFLYALNFLEHLPPEDQIKALPAGVKERAWFVHNLALEAVLSHGRNLIDFFCATKEKGKRDKPSDRQAAINLPPARDEDVIAADLAPGWGEIQDRFEDLPQILALRSDVNKKLAHLSGKRNIGTDWDPHGIRKPLFAMAKLFRTGLGDGRLPLELFQVLDCFEDSRYGTFSVTTKEWSNEIFGGGILVPTDGAPPRFPFHGSHHPKAQLDNTAGEEGIGPSSSPPQRFSTETTWRPLDDARRPDSSAESSRERPTKCETDTKADG